MSRPSWISDMERTGQTYNNKLDKPSTIRLNIIKHVFIILHIVKIVMFKVQF